MKRSLFSSKLVPGVLVAVVVLASSCANRDVHRILQSNIPQAPDSPKLLAVYMPWFGNGTHLDVGYSSQDPQVLRRQIQQARNLGISAFVVDWYGIQQPFLDKSFALLQQAAAEQHFQVALMYDQPEDSGAEETDDAMQDFASAYEKYVGPQAPYRDTYLRYQGRPLVFIFPKNNGTDWDRVRQQVNGWATPPLLIYKDEPPSRYQADFDGYYPWVHPDGDWSRDGNDWGQKYLENFYRTMQRQYPGKIPIGAAWPGFDDELAPWGLNRYIASHCGKTLESTLRLFRRYYSNDSDRLPFLLIETWNDYEEGTAIEKLAFSPCSGDRTTGSGGPSRAAR